MDLSFQQFTLIEYYHRKQESSLKATQKKYEEYAKLLSEQCNQLRGEVNTLYSYLKEACVFVDNAKSACTQITKEIKELEREKNNVFPWCKRNELESEDSDSGSESDTTR